MSASTGAFFRCLYALPPLLVLAVLEDRRLGPRRRRARWLAVIAGAFFAADLILWHHSIEYVGAGLATVLGNTQVLMVGLLAWMLLDERPPNRALAAIPIAFGGVVLISGVLEDGAYGDDPTLGVIYGVLTGVAYSGFLLALRQGSTDGRRGAALRRDGGGGRGNAARRPSSSATSTSCRPGRLTSGSSCWRSARRCSAGS